MMRRAITGIVIIKALRIHHIVSTSPRLRFLLAMMVAVNAIMALADATSSAKKPRVRHPQGKG